MTKGRKKKKITPDNLAQREKEVFEEWGRIQESLKKKPSWMIDENSTFGEVLEFHAITMPFKWRQIIEIEEQTAQRLSEFAKIFHDRPKEKAKWLKHAETSRRHAEEMRQKTWMIRRTAEIAQKEIDELT